MNSKRCVLPAQLGRRRTAAVVGTATKRDKDCCRRAQVAHHCQSAPSPAASVSPAALPLALLTTAAACDHQGSARLPARCRLGHFIIPVVGRRGVASRAAAIRWNHPARLDNTATSPTHGGKRTSGGLRHGAAVALSSGTCCTAAGMGNLQEAEVCRTGAAQMTPRLCSNRRYTPQRFLLATLLPLSVALLLLMLPTSAAADQAPPSTAADLGAFNGGPLVCLLASCQRDAPL